MTQILSHLKCVAKHVLSSLQHLRLSSSSHQMLERAIRATTQTTPARSTKRSNDSNLTIIEKIHKKNPNDGMVDDGLQYG
jgi:hypothetical protein